MDTANPAGLAVVIRREAPAGMVRVRILKPISSADVAAAMEPVAPGILPMRSPIPPPPAWLQECPDACEIYRALAAECGAIPEDTQWAGLLAAEALALSSLRDLINWGAPADKIAAKTVEVRSALDALLLTPRTIDRLLREFTAPAGLTVSCVGIQPSQS